MEEHFTCDCGDTWGYMGKSGKLWDL
ncbi:uncharacterized protein G2W53_022438 [Senna tora]|uniref:Uncharacterized protein n=1 Tax=Senna tora TaxID=362788 RepID=A0A834TUD5_9FABA|nr:uncharacterized protein G2W53_022438 [Senna tora]